MLIKAGLKTSGECLGTWFENESMAAHVSWKAGGHAQAFFRPRDAQALVEWFEQISDERVYPLGLGSNLLVRDGGFKGIVLCTHHALSQVSMHTAEEKNLGQGNKGWIYAEAGVPCPKVARFAIHHGLKDAEWLATIPGTVGGALAMNAGCYGFETWSYVRRVAVVIPGVGYREYDPVHYAISYRSVKLDSAYVGHEQPHYFLGAWFEFPEDAGTGGVARMKGLLTRRIQTQPLNLPNAGSVFRNPEGDFAARLIEECGLKGVRVGGAEVSQKHANFIVNPEGSASATDIERLMDAVKARVADQTGVVLVPEVRIIGEPM